MDEPDRPLSLVQPVKFTADGRLAGSWLGVSNPLNHQLTNPLIHRRWRHEYPAPDRFQDAPVDGFALLRGGKRWFPNRSRTPPRHTEPAPAVTSQLFPGHHIILGQ